MALITQVEIIETVEVSEYLSVNKIKDSAILKSELMLADDILGDTFYDDLVAKRSSQGTFDNTNYQTLYDKYLKRLLSEMVVLNHVTSIVLELSSKGLENSNDLTAIKAIKAEYSRELDASKRLLKKFLTNNANDYPLYFTVQAEQKALSNFVGGFYVGERSKKRESVTVEVNDQKNYAYTASAVDGTFTIDYSNDINVYGTQLEITIINSLGATITNFDFVNNVARFVDVTINDFATEANRTGTITIKVTG